MKEFRYLPGVSTLVLDAKTCVGCRACEAVCPHGVFRVAEGNAAIVDRDGCMECGACARNCPTASIQVTPGVGCAAYIIKRWMKGKGATACGGTKCC